MARASLAWARPTIHMWLVVGKPAIPGWPESANWARRRAGTAAGASSSTPRVCGSRATRSSMGGVPS
ncbi:hypothetical protein G6F58_013831 [Rhizopus delemar]|nr:hypothetical protein G6F58_013831 [Rhizopus delemar]